jgi:dipeptidyl aminopeptidase/acylaminoacyl peptidase
MKELILMFVLMTTSFAANSLDIRGDANVFSGKITSVTLTDDGGVINVVGNTGKYGKVWLTYNLALDNPNHPTQGSFSGRATAINDEGARDAASRQGVWERKGNIISFYSLDDVTDGNFYLCLTDMNLSTDTVDMKFYSVK